MTTEQQKQEQAKREEWLAERSTGLGGSDAAAVCGMSPWSTPLDVYMEKVGYLDGIGKGSDQETPAMRRGTLLEPVVIQMYADETGMMVRKPDTMFRCDAYPWAVANVDGLVGQIENEDAVLECKTARSKHDWGDPWTAEIPMVYLFQVQHYMAVLEIPVAHVAVLFGMDFEFAIYEVPADAEFQELMMEQEADFWKLVESRTPPDPINDADVHKRWPNSKPIGRKATKADLEIGGHLLAVREYYKKLEAYKESLESELKRSMEDSDTLVFGDETVATWKTAKGRTKFDAKRLQKEHPDIYEQYVSQSAPSRRFLFKDGAKCVQIWKPLLHENLLPNRELLAGS